MCTGIQSPLRMNRYRMGPCLCDWQRVVRIIADIERSLNTRYTTSRGRQTRTGKTCIQPCTRAKRVSFPNSENNPRTITIRRLTVKHLQKPRSVQQTCFCVFYWWITVVPSLLSELKLNSSLSKRQLSGTITCSRTFARFSCRKARSWFSSNKN